MNRDTIYESNIEEASLSWFAELGYTVLHGPDIAPDTPDAERSSYNAVILTRRLRDAVAHLNPNIPTDAQEEAVRKVLNPDSPALVQNNRTFHQMLVDGIEVEYRQLDGTIRGARVRFVDFDTPENNDWLAVNQFTVVETSERRPDIVLFINGLPLAVIELKNPTDEKATVLKAFRQIQTYKQEIPELFTYNEAIIISDGSEARIGSLTADTEWFLPWRTIEGADEAPSTELELEVLIRGAFEKHRFLSYLKHFIVFEEIEGGMIAKKIAGYHQYHAVQTAVETTLKASHIEGNQQCGIVSHTQGSGKSLTMAFYAGSIIQHPQMENPTLVVITDTNDLDDQLFGTFARCHQLLRQTPAQAQSRRHLRELLKVASGGVIFTTVQKFFPEGEETRFPQLSDRRNIVLIADEAHRSQYGFIDGFARHIRDALPNASFIGFTGTPIELTDRNTVAVFGDYISVYDIQQAVQDGATVPIYYESRLAKIELDETEKPHIDPEFEEVTETEEVAQKEKLKTKWAQLEKLMGTEKRLGLIADDIIAHFEERLETMDGKGMIVCMSRRICVDLYDAIVKRRPEWHDNDDKNGVIKVVMTGSASDDISWQPHIRNKPRREEMAVRFKNANDPLKLVIVRDMWLTGFDAPSLHTMYVDKPMRGHGLMQAIARVNRVYRDKPGGLIVDYIGLAYHLKQALQNYTQSGGKGETTLNKADAVAVMLEKYEICCGLFHGFDWSPWTIGNAEDRIRLLPPAQEHILAQKDGKERLLSTVTELFKAFVLAVPHEKTTEIRDAVAFFQAVRSVLAKPSTTEEVQAETTEQAIKQLVSKAVASEGVVDIFTAAGLEKPDVSILSDEFLAEVQDLPHKNVAVELLERLLNDEIRTRSQKNVVQGRSFASMLERSIRTYQNRTIEAAQVIEALIQIAKEMRQAQERGDDLGLSDEELAFYDALEVKDSAVMVLGDETLRTIAVELVETVRRNVSIDWTMKESARAKIRVMVKRTLLKHGYPPDKREKAAETVLEQAEVLCNDWAA
ncbi:type I restriction endonuclease subunit R [Candidatus Poribacteria bacterium]|nr:type I restriction endonuclease subunit R [Candidatus Poribacteria bacterium]MYG06626.1 type I restriction endonuclease subunit R [Candidatus Poribacteria bacterium]MYK25161.1 type I restriction endonuclease subunit R [Candidatus Poribacteria bacterium]